MKSRTIIFSYLEQIKQTDMKCIAIDDEKPGLDLICSYIDKIPFVELTGAFSDMTAAINHIIDNPVDLILTDIELNSDMNGIEFIRSLSKPPMVIFITAYDRYAVEGFSVDAVDYLLKPVTFVRFSKAINKAYEQHRLLATLRDSGRQAATPEMQEQMKGGISSDCIFVKTENRYVKVFFSDILYIKGFGDYVKIRLSDSRTILSLQTLNNLESILPDAFIRIHRSFIVSIDKIDEIERRRVRIGDEIIPIGENYMETFQKRILP